MPGNYREIVIWCCRTGTFPVLKQAKLQEIVYEDPVYSSALGNNIFLRIWIFLSTSFEEQGSKPFEPLEWSAHGSV